jgi:hypothetical protein
VNDRSFAKLTRTAMFHLAPPLCSPQHESSLLGITGRYAIHILVKYLAVWELDAAEHWRAIGPASEGTASAGQALNATTEQANAEREEMRKRCYKIIAYSPDDDIIPTPAQLLPGLLHEQNGTASSGHSQIGSVLLMRSSSRRRPVQGEAHNRSFTDEEDEALFGAIERAFAGLSLPATL